MPEKLAALKLLQRNEEEMRRRGEKPPSRAEILRELGRA